ncbi:MAG: gamma-glutamyltransferase [Thermomicrobiales bacterium]
MSLTREQTMTHDLRHEGGPEVVAGPPRDLTMARRGMVASMHPFASEAGLEMLRRGGNAIDAAIAAAAVLTVVEPGNGHLGGDTFILIGHADGEVVALNGSGAAPSAATLDRYQAMGGIPEDGLLSATVPGTVDCWAHASARYGALPLAAVLEPAIWYAENGVPVNARLHQVLTLGAPVFRKYPASVRVFLPNGDVPPVGGVLRQAGLGASLRRIAAGGRDELYTGALAAEMVAFSAANGGLFTREDFAVHATEERAPISVKYRGFTVYEQPPVSQGLIVLLALGIMRQFDARAMGLGSAALIHLQIEALKLAVEDRLRWLGDPAFVDVPLDMLLSEEHAREQAALIDPARTRPLAPLGQRQPDTTYLCAADESGTMVSYIHSLFTGSGVVLGETGVLMNSRLLGFDLDPASPNCLAPGKRPVHTLNPWLVAKDGQTVLVGGTPGAQWQVQTNLQLLTNLLDFGLDVQRAIEVPRFTYGNQRTVDDPTISLESRVKPAVVAELRAKGHPIELTGPWAAGGAMQLIARDPATGILSGAAEPRLPGCTVAGY